MYFLSFFSFFFSFILRARHCRDPQRAPDPRRKRGGALLVLEPGNLVLRRLRHVLERDRVCDAAAIQARIVEVHLARKKIYVASS